MGRNVRQHVNPLGLHYQRSRARALQIPDAYQDAPLEVELGCADGDFSFELAARCPERFVVGLEIREAMVERNLSRLAREGLSNLTFAYVNMNVDLDRVFSKREVRAIAPTHGNAIRGNVALHVDRVKQAMLEICG